MSKDEENVSAMDTNENSVRFEHRNFDRKKNLNFFLVLDKRIFDAFCVLFLHKTAYQFTIAWKN